jgi:PadR family transcriptional regulator PadR
VPEDTSTSESAAGALGKRAATDAPEGNRGRDSHGRRRGRYRRAVMEPTVLMLLVDAEAHGYDLIERVTSLVGDEVCIDRGTLYRLLRSMEERELVISSWEVTDRGPNRRTYRILPAGRESLERDIQALRRRAGFLNSLADEAEARLQEV